MDRGKFRKHFLISITILFIIVSSLSFLFTAKAESIDTDEDGLEDWQEKLIGTNDSESRSPGLYCLYKDSYNTKKYTSWKTFSDNNGSFTIGLERIVIRRGTTVELGGHPEGNISIEPTKRNMDNLQADGMQIEIPEDNSVGKYEIIMVEGGWQTKMDLFVVFDPFKTSLSEEEINAYGYDEHGSRDERGYIYTTSNKLLKGDLYPFGDGNDNLTDIYEFALAGVGNTSDPISASVKLVRIVAQRNTAAPGEPPQLRDPRSILYFNQGKIQGLTLEDAEKLSMNGVSRDDLADPDHTKTLAAWCDECAFALTGLLRSIGIPSRITSLHPSPDTELMGHYVSEAWFEESMYKADYLPDKGDWYALDADEWNAEWYTQQPKFWMPMGECFSSRSNYGFASEHLFRVNYEYDVAHYYVLGTEDIDEPTMNEVTKEYEDREFPELKYGELTKYKGRGGGDFYKLKVDNYSKLTISSTSGIEPNIYLNEEDFPALKISYQGYPPNTPNKNLTDKEMVLEPGEYYVAIFAPQVSENENNTLEGNYGTYTLELKEASKSEIESAKDDELKVGIHKYITGVVILIVWIISLVIMKYT